MVRALEEISLIETRNERQMHAQGEELAVFTSVRALSAGTGVLSVGTRAQKPGSAVLNDEFFESDTGWRVRWSGTAWLYSSGVAIGTNATRAAITVTVNDNGALFYATDTKLLWRVSAGAWVQADITPAAHKDLHKSGGTDAFTSSDLLEAIVKRLQESAGPTTLTLGAVADGEFLKRVGTTVVGAVASGAITNELSQSVLASIFAITNATGVYQNTGLSVALPAAGTFKINADVRYGVSFTGAGTALYIVSKLYNSTDAAYVTNSERMVCYHDVPATLQIGAISLHMPVVVAAAKTIQLHVARFFTGTATASNIESDANGRTALSYTKVA